MSNFIKLCMLSLVLSVATANAAEGMKGVTFSGDVEGGWNYTWKSTPQQNESEFMLDQATMKMEANVSDKTKIVFTNAIAINPSTGNLTAPGTTTNFNSVNFFSDATLKAAGSPYAISNLDAYIDHKWTTGVHTWIGHFETPFGMESMGSRFDMATYYYSAAFAGTNNQNGLGWMYDEGIKLALTDILPGTLEVAVTDGRGSLVAGSNQRYTPAESARWSMEWKKGDMSLTPVVSAWLGRWAGGPQDLGLTAGGMWKMGAIFANAEFVYTSTSLIPAVATVGKTTLWSIYLEPGIDLGMVTVSAKVDMDNQTLLGVSNSDFNIGAAISHDYAGDFRVKLAYMHTGLSNNINPNVNDLRLLFGVKF